MAVPALTAAKASFTIVPSVAIDKSLLLLRGSASLDGSKCILRQRLHSGDRQVASASPWRASIDGSKCILHSRCIVAIDKALLFLRGGASIDGSKSLLHSRCIVAIDKALLFLRGGASIDGSKSLLRQRCTEANLLIPSFPSFVPRDPVTFQAASKHICHLSDFKRKVGLIPVGDSETFNQNPVHRFQLWRVVKRSRLFGGPHPVFNVVHPIDLRDNTLSRFVAVGENASKLEEALVLDPAEGFTWIFTNAHDGNSDFINGLTSQRIHHAVRTGKHRLDSGPRGRSHRRSVAGRRRDAGGLPLCTSDGCCNGFGSKVNEKGMEFFVLIFSCPHPRQKLLKLLLFLFFLTLDEHPIDAKDRSCQSLFLLFCEISLWNLLLLDGAHVRECLCSSSEAWISNLVHPVQYVDLTTLHFNWIELLVRQWRVVPSK